MMFLRQKAKFKSCLKKLQVENLDIKNKLSQLERAYENLSLEFEEAKTVCIVISYKKDDKTYSDKFRKAAYYCLQNQVPVETTSNVINHVLEELADVSIANFASAGTISQYSYELGVMSDLQVGDVLINNDNLTRSWDATSLAGDHVNEIHITIGIVPPTGYVMQVAVLPGGEAVDYANHVKESLHDIVHTYSSFHNISAVVTEKKVISHLKNTMSDCVNVNAAAVRELERDLDIKLLSLNCNVHPLESVARKCWELLKTYDTDNSVESNTFGSDCRAANLLYGISKMRYKQGKGDLHGFTLFLKKHDLKCGVIVRYVGNRFHIIFHLAGVVIHLYDKLCLYFHKMCNNQTTLRSALLKDLQNTTIVLELRVLGLLGKLLTGPWMVKFYAN
ncbi:uncharacterized protein LOC126821183 isoform X1 [Patella vulgata]|uniref:uncharacterized protein LOC126821183 isoform X1 n=1 Tax=Patella vulgata TaxID=6465 RepID=UPI0024A819AC|nr:uncharacterized protein LOC126821183 isoform X1 [Patella vulgata]XP_050405544.2 uncharacterized protein LOC126821183 isoform X1 [Patella vulgata]XP_055957371.1 uncharacterized protein LOC126821183 isoform X1 [Patella vulgata]